MLLLSKLSPETRKRIHVDFTGAAICIPHRRHFLSFAYRANVLPPTPGASCRARFSPSRDLPVGTTNTKIERTSLDIAYEVRGPLGSIGISQSRVSPIASGVKERNHERRGRLSRRPRPSAAFLAHLMVRMRRRIGATIYSYSREI